ncbi:MAG: response regulator [Candidatus Omnitrophica bacterium]|nr:response regulator [Candidatus Omnitrophota bacterium]
MKKILIVDDEPDILLVLGERLRAAGFAVSEAKTGKETIALAKAESPDLIILDIVLPDLDGGEVAQVLSADHATASIPIIFLTGLYTKEDEEKGHQVKEHYFLAKPFDSKDLLAIINKTIRKE